MICIYHSRDLDGYTCGAIAKMAHPEAILIGYDYGQPIPWDKISKGEEIVMMDVSLKMQDMLTLWLHSGKKLTWIDHHISAMNDYQEFVSNNGEFLTPVLDNSISACEGAWKYFFPDKEIPEAVLLLGEYDTWRNKDVDRWNNRILPFQFGIRIQCHSPETFPIKVLELLPSFADSIIDDIIDEGITVIKYQEQVNIKQARSSFEAEFQGLRVICLNAGGFNSDLFKSIWDENKYDMMMPFQFNGKQWNISLYTTKDDVDCSVVAKSMGGGGHKKAAGFQVSSLSDLFSQLTKPK